MFLIPCRVFAVFLWGCVPAIAADWPEFLGPNRDGTSPETGLLESWPATGLAIAWQMDVGTGYSVPSVRDGILVLHHRVRGDEIVDAMDAATGAVKWTYSYPSSYQDPFGYNNGPRCPPLLTADRCYTFGAEGMLVCSDLKTGKALWSRATQKDFEVPEAFFGVGSSPVLEDGKLIVQVGGQPDSNVVAFDAATGKTLWQNGGAKTWDGALMQKWPGEPFVKWDTGHPAFQKMSSYCTPVLATNHGRRHVLTVIHHFTGAPARLPCIWKENCSNQFISVDSKGTVAQCDCWVTSYPETFFGNVFRDENLTQMLRESPARREFVERPKHLVEHEDCLSCRFLSICHGGCPVRTYSALGTMLAKDPYCEVYKAVFGRAESHSRALLRRELLTGRKPASPPSPARPTTIATL